MDRNVRDLLISGAHYLTASVAEFTGLMWGVYALAKDEPSLASALGAGVVYLTGRGFRYLAEVGSNVAITADSRNAQNKSLKSLFDDQESPKGPVESSSQR